MIGKACYLLRKGLVGVHKKLHQVRQQWTKKTNTLDNTTLGFERPADNTLATELIAYRWDAWSWHLVRWANGRQISMNLSRQMRTWLKTVIQLCTRTRTPLIAYAKHLGKNYIQRSRVLLQTRQRWCQIVIAFVWQVRYQLIRLKTFSWCVLVTHLQAQART